MTLSRPTFIAYCRPDRDRFLADVEVAEAADQPEPVQLPGALLEAADEQHLLVEIEQFVLRRLIARRLGRAFAIGAARGRRFGHGLLGGSRHIYSPHSYGRRAL